MEKTNERIEKAKDAEIIIKDTLDEYFADWLVEKITSELMEKLTANRIIGEAE